jgi:PBP1b-binding outer membrane lipoprotein LpoB
MKLYICSARGCLQTLAARLLQGEFISPQSNNLKRKMMGKYLPGRVFIMGVKLHCYSSGLLMVCLFMALILASCQSEKDEKDKPEKETASANSAPEVKKEPQISVGNVNLTLPAPKGFERLGTDDLIKHKAFLTADASAKGGVLLCAFVRKNSAAGQNNTGGNARGKTGEDASANSADLSSQQAAAVVSSVEESSPGSEITPADFDILQVNTLQKWLNSSFSIENFNEMTAQWQRTSIACDAQTVAYFIEAAKTRLENVSGYTYNLGLAGYSREQISFARIIKAMDAEGRAYFICSVKSLFYSSGKIIGLDYSQRINEFTEISSVIGEHMVYLNELQSGAEAAYPQQITNVPGKTPLSVSQAHSFSRGAGVSALYGSYYKNRNWEWYAVTFKTAF